MTSLDQKLQDWIVQESRLISEGRLKTIPSVSTLSRLTVGKNKRVWNYVIEHVRSRHATNKIRRILRAKHMEIEQDEDSKSTTCEDPNLLRQKVTVVNEKCIFLKSSVSHIKDKIMSIEESIRNLRNNIDKINQRTALLEMLTLKYKEKNLVLISIQNKLSFNMCNRFPYEKVSSTPHSVVLSNREDEDNTGLDYLLSQVLSLVMKKLNDNADFEPSKETVRKRIDQKLKSISISDLIYYLKDSAKVSSRVVLKTASTAVTSDKSYKENLSEKQLQDMKLGHIQSVFNATKALKENEILVKVKDSLIEGKIKSMVNSEDEEFPTKQKLFKVVLENEALNAAIKYFEETLSKVAKDNRTLQEKNKQQMLNSQDVESAMKTFYKDFDLMWDLFKSVPDTCQEITKFLSFLHSYANEHVFLTLTPDLRDYSLIMEEDLKSRMEIFWNTCDQTNIARPSVWDPVLPESDALWDATNVPRFYNTSTVVNKIKHVKEMLREHQEENFQFKSDNVISMEKQYNGMMDVLKETKIHLELSEGQLEQCSELSKELSVAVKDWWEQGAQYIHKISCEDKTLKMWQDILKILSDYQ